MSQARRRRRHRHFSPVLLFSFLGGASTALGSTPVGTGRHAGLGRGGYLRFAGKSGVSAAELTEFKKHLVNLAGGGLRLPLQAPVEMAELVLVYLSLGDKKGIICALAEAVWIGPVQNDETQSIGLRFLNILEDDQDRIDVVVKALLARLGKTGDE